MIEENVRTVVVTHDGRHHADELLACWFLRVLYHGEIRIVRSTDPKIMESADFLLDCGGKYDPSCGRFDHHGSRDNLPVPPPGRVAGYATAGLVWRRYGIQIMKILLAEWEGPWNSFCESLGSKRKVRECYTTLSDILDQEIIAPIDAWDLGVYPDKSYTRYVLPCQWLLSQIDFETAMNALGKSFAGRLRSLAEGMAGEGVMLRDLLENGPGQFWVLGDWVVAQAAPGARLDLRAAKRFSGSSLKLPLLAVLSTIRGGSRWGAFLSQPLPRSFAVPAGVEYAAGRRSFFHDSSEILLDFLRDVVNQNALPFPFARVESGHDLPPRSHHVAEDGV